MTERSPSQTPAPAATVAFGDVAPSGTSSQESTSEAETGVQDSTRALSGDEGLEADDQARGVSSEKAPRAAGDVDTTPLSRRS
jgi:hypothetical protein